MTFPDGAAASDVREMTQATRRFALELRDTIAVISDLSRVKTTDPETRKIYADFVRELRSEVGHRVRGIAVILRSPFQRAMLNLHFLLVGKTPYPVRAFSDRDEALPWLHARLGAAR